MKNDIALRDGPFANTIMQENITVAGESAGAVYTHALIVMDAPVKRAILQSGSLHLSPPTSLERGAPLLRGLQNFVRNDCGKSLRDAPVSSLLRGLEKLNVRNMWLQAVPELEDWQRRSEHVEELMIGDCQNEVCH